MGTESCRDWKSNNGSLDLYWAKGALCPFKFKQLQWGLNLEQGWTCNNGRLDLYWSEGAFGPFKFKQLQWGPDLVKFENLVIGAWTRIGLKGPSAPSNLNNSN